ncbi:MAG: HAD-IA family hydrolase [Granulosicoccus sp.]|nr:HAD-IA family hydrolase [Granulosicoccus sp.]
MNLQHVAIDLDGTLLDSVGDLHAAVVSMQSTLNLSYSSLNEVQSWIGNGIDNLVQRALSHSRFQHDGEIDQAQALHVFKEAYRNTNGQFASVYPGVIEGLEWLSQLGIPLSVVTNKSREFTVPLLEKTKLQHYFSHTVCGDDVLHKKPAPDALLVCAGRANSDPSHSLMIGDSINDFIAARRAGFRLLAVSYGYNHGVSPSDLDEKDRPELLVDSLAELPSIKDSILY